jgi:hypothetical protein
MTVLDTTERKIRIGTGTLTACMGGSCLVVLPILPALSFPGMLLPAATAFGGLFYASYRWKQSQLGGLPELASYKSAHAETLPDDHPASIAVTKASRQARIKRPRSVIVEDLHSLSVCYGEDLIAFDRRFLAQATPDELEFAAGHELARAKFAGREKRIDTRHHITQIFNFTTRVLYFGLITGITALNAAAWMLHSSTSLTTEVVNNNIPLWPQYMLAGLSASAMTAFFTRGLMLRNITIACDLQAVKAAGTIAGAQHLLKRMDRDYPIPYEHFLATDMRWASAQVKSPRLKSVFNAAAVFIESLPTIVSAPLNYFLALGQDRRPRTERRLRLLRAFAIETGLGGLDEAQEKAPVAPVAVEGESGAKENRGGATPVPADAHPAASVAAAKAITGAVTGQRPPPPAL